MKEKVYIFGTGSTGRRIYDDIKEQFSVIGFLDNDVQKWGGNVENVPIIGDPQKILSTDFDEIIIASLPAMDIIKRQLLELGVPAGKVNTEYVSVNVRARINFIRDYADLYKEKADGYAVAEGGVFQGEFAKEINACFPECKLYLFDTFEGFDSRDTVKEHEEGLSIFDGGHLADTSVDMVLGKLPYREKAVVRAGYFPMTTEGLEDEKFFFVNLDFDLYNPTLEGLRFFYPRLAENGLILIHDYYNPGYGGIKKAISDYEKESGTLRKFPIGDHCSIAILKSLSF